MTGEDKPKYMKKLEMMDRIRDAIFNDSHFRPKAVHCSPSTLSSVKRLSVGEGITWGMFLFLRKPKYVEISLNEKWRVKLDDIG